MLLLLLCKYRVDYKYWLIAILWILKILLSIFWIIFVFHGCINWWITNIFWLFIFYNNFTPLILYPLFIGLFFLNNRIVRNFSRLQKGILVELGIFILFFLIDIIFRCIIIKLLRKIQIGRRVKFLEWRSINKFKRFFDYLLSLLLSTIYHNWKWQSNTFFAKIG